MRRPSNVHLPKGSNRIQKPKDLSGKNNVYWGDESWNMVLNLMLGIQKSVKRTAATLDPRQALSVEDFAEKSFHNLATVKTTNFRNKLRKGTFFMDYAPNVFERIRQMYGINSVDYIKSIGVDKILNNLLMSDQASLTELISSGKSGSFFYYSDDGLYMVKTVDKGESKFLRQILGAYFQHL